MFLFSHSSRSCSFSEARLILSGWVYWTKLHGLDLCYLERQKHRGFVCLFVCQDNTDTELGSSWLLLTPQRCWVMLLPPDACSPLGFCPSPPWRWCAVPCAYKCFFMAMSLLQGVGGYFSLKTVAGDQVSTIVCTIQILNWPPASLIVTLTGVVMICLLLVVFRYCCYRSKFWQASIPRIG